MLVEEIVDLPGKRALRVYLRLFADDVAHDDVAPCFVVSGLFGVPCIEGFELSVYLFSFLFEGCPSIGRAVA